MELRLVSYAICPYVHRSASLLREKGVTFHVDYIDLKNKPAWFLDISPRGRVPLLVADGHVLFESAVINEFLDETIGDRLMPADPFERARQRAWVEVANELFTAQYKYTTVRTEDFEQARTQQAAILARLEEEIHGPHFGEHFGLVDIATAPALVRMVLMEERTSARFFETTPKVGAWARALAKRPAIVRSAHPGFETLYFDYIRGKDGHFARTFLAP